MIFDDKPDVHRRGLQRTDNAEPTGADRYPGGHKTTWQRYALSEIVNAISMREDEMKGSNFYRHNSSL